MQLRPISFDVKGVDDGKKTSRQKDRDEAILDAKYQALAKTGSEISSLERYRLELSEGKISQDSYRQEIEDRSTGRFLPDCKIEELGYINGSYTVRFMGSIAPDPIGSIETSQSSLQKNYQSNNNSRIIESQEINRTLENIKTGDIASWVAGGQKYTMQITHTINIDQEMPCRKYTLRIGDQNSVNTYTACRNKYGAWRNQ